MAPARQRYSEAQAAISSNNLDLAIAILLGEHHEELTSTSEAAVSRIHNQQENQEVGSPSGVSQYRVRANLVDGLLLRVAESSRASRFQDAWSDLDKATLLQGETDRISAMRNDILLGIEESVKEFLAVGRVEEAERLVVGCLAGGKRSPSMTSLLELVHQVRVAERLSKQGRFVEAIHRIEAACSERFGKVVESLVGKWRSMHDKLRPFVFQLNVVGHNAASTEASEIARKVLEIAPMHPEANRIKAIADQPKASPATEREVRMIMDSKLPNSGPFVTGGERATGEAKKPPNPTNHVLWIDGVGGYLLCLSSEVVIGQAVPGNRVDLPIVGDLSRRSAAIRRSGEDHLLQPLQEVLLNDTKMERAALLANGDLITLGGRVSLRVTRGSGLSSTTRLDLVSHHRWQPHVDGVLLMADACILGPNAGSHVLCPFWSEEVVLFRYQNKLYCRANSPLEVNGVVKAGQIELVSGSRIRGSDFSFGLE